MQREIRRRGGFAPLDGDPVQVIDAAGCVAQLCPVLSGGRASAVSIVAVNEEVMGLQDIPRGVAAVSKPELPLADVSLIAENLLMQARTLADSGAPTVAIRAILDHVDALREGGC